jgi:transposase
MDVVVDRVAGLDVHKDTVMAAVRVPGSKGGRQQTIRQFRSYTRDLQELRDWLVSEKVSVVVMEATGVYWRPLWHVLEEVPSFQLELVNAHHVKRVPGRKTDVSDAAWLAQLAECGLLRGSFVPPPTIAHLRDLTRYRKKLIADRAKEAQRIQKLLEDAGVKLDSVVTDILGQSARDMLDGLLAGEQDTAVLANHARGRMRAKVPDLRLALEGRFGEHHHFLLRMHLQHVDHLTAGIQQLDEEVARLMAPFAEPVRRLCTIPGVGRRSAEIILAEIGVDMGRFPTAGHLASWAGMCPGHHESAGKQRSGRARKGNAALRSVLCEVAWAATHTKNTYLSAQFRRLCRRFGKGGSNKAVFALGHTILVIVWHLLQHETDYQELGADYFAQRHETDTYRQRLVHQLEKLGHRVTLEPSAAA